MKMLWYTHNIDWEDHVRNNSILQMAKVKTIAVSMRRRGFNGLGAFAEEIGKKI